MEPPFNKKKTWLTSYPLSPNCFRELLWLVAVGVSLRLIFIPFVLVVTSRKPFTRLHFPSQLPFIANYTKQVNTKHWVNMSCLCINTQNRMWQCFSKCGFTPKRYPLQSQLPPISLLGVACCHAVEPAVCLAKGLGQQCGLKFEHHPVLGINVPSMGMDIVPVP